MNYEKAYKGALERAKQSLTYPDYPGFMRVDVIFPELAESEDEKIRKALISILKSDFENDTTIHDISVGDIIAWLEKQGEQKQSWNERDEKNMNTIINVIYGGTHLAYENEIDWLKSLKYRIKGE